MHEHLDLAALAESIDQPFSPHVAVARPPVEVEVLVCEGPRSWTRETQRSELWMVLEGVLTLDGTFGHVVVNEGEVVFIPPKIEHKVFSGMRTNVIRVHRSPQTGRENGHYTPPLAGEIRKVNVGVAVLQSTPFNWLNLGLIAVWHASATRVAGASTQYEVPDGGVILIVYRGVLDWRSADAEGTVVGSQLLQLEPGMRLTLDAERGATVLALTREGAPLPEAATVSGAA